MRPLPHLYYVLIAGIGFLTSPIYSQKLPEPGSAELQQESIASQMDEIAVKSAQAQADSIRQQAAAVRQQYGVSPGGSEQSTLDVAADNMSKGRSAPIAKISAVPSLAGGGTGANLEPANPEAPRQNGFFTVPWHPSDDFVMPSVQVDTSACDALANNDINQLVKDASGKYKLDPTLLRAVIRQESGLRPCAISTAGAMGLMQIMPDTAQDLGLNDPFDPSANVDAGAHYLKQMLDRYNGNTALALAAYNAGPERTDKANGIPPITETIGYVSSILSSIPLF